MTKNVTEIVLAQAAFVRNLIDKQIKRLEALDIACDGLHHIRQEYDSSASFFLEKAKAVRHPAVLFRRKIYVAGPHHKDAIDLAFAGMPQHQVHRIYDRVMDGKEEIVFGVAREDGSEACSLQPARKAMYGFHVLSPRRVQGVQIVLCREAETSAPTQLGINRATRDG